MANIPIGNFGNVMPQAQPGRVIDSGAGQVAQAVQNLGQVGMQVSAKKLNEQQKIQDEKDEYFFNTQAAKYGAEYTDIVTTTKQKLVTGEYDENTAKAYLRQQSDNLTETYRQTLPETKHEKFNYYSEKMYLESEVNVKPLAYETERRAINADFEQVAEATLKIENREQAYALYLDTVNRNPVLTPEQKKEAPQKWNERRDLSDAKGVLSGLEGQQDVKALQELQKNVDTVFPHMKVETRDAYKANIDSAIDRINKGQAIQAKELDREHAQLTKDFVADAFTGFPISTSLVNSTLDALKGTKYEAEVKEALALNKDAQAFRKSSPVEQERSVNRLTSELENTPQEDATLLQKKLNVFKSIMTTSKQRANDDPIASIQSQTGRKLYTVTPEEIGSGQIDYKKAQITTSLLAEQKKTNGGTGSLIQWNTSERTAFKERYFNATPAQQSKMIADINKLSDSKTPEGRDARKEYMALIGGEKQANDYIGISKLKELDVFVPNTNLKAADLALEGKQIIRQGQHTVVGDAKQFMLSIAPNFGNTAQPTNPERIAYQNVAYSIYLGLANKQGGIKVDDKGNPLINKALAQQAFELASGGTYHQKLGKNTQTVYRTYGLSSSQFEEKLEDKVIGGYWKDTGKVIPRGFLKEHAIEQVPGAYGMYRFRNPDGSIHINQKTKQPYTVQITKH